VYSLAADFAEVYSPPRLSGDIFPIGTPQESVPFFLEGPQVGALLPVHKSLAGFDAVVPFRS